MEEYKKIIGAMYRFAKKREIVADEDLNIFNAHKVEVQSMFIREDGSIDIPSVSTTCPFKTADEAEVIFQDLMLSQIMALHTGWSVYGHCDDGPNIRYIVTVKTDEAGSRWDASCEKVVKSQAWK